MIVIYIGAGDWPLVLKPDVEQRGEGVAVIRSESAAAAYLSANEEPVIAQRYIPGAEFGVFYYRLPGEPVPTWREIAAVLRGHRKRVPFEAE